jgi:hypothetical protein
MTIAKEAATLRREIEAELTAGKNSSEATSNKSVIDHLEDLQENIANLNYAFNEMYESNKEYLVGEAEHIYQERVRKAQEERNDGIFEL